jgi:hypothetical protein
MIGNLGYLWTLYKSARDGDPNAGKALDLVLSNTPFVNLFDTRPAIDFLFINLSREIVRPGYLVRQSTRLKKEQGQEFVLPRTLGEALAN